MEENSVIVAHPLQQHSYRTAESLNRGHKLLMYVTTVYYNPEKLIYRLLGKFISKDNVSRMTKRRNESINNKTVSKHTFLGLFYLFIIRIDKKKVIEPFIYTLLVFFFSKSTFKIVKKLSPKAVIMYDTTASKVFSKIKKNKMNVKTILDMTSTPAFKIRKILTYELDNNYDKNSNIKQKLKSYTSKKVKKYNLEIANSDYILVSSHFVKETLLSNGISESKLLYIPYGVDVTTFTKTERIRKERIQFMYAGRIEHAKGIYYLIEAFKALEGYPVQLNLVGPDYIDIKNIIINSTNIKYHGSKRRDEMQIFYSNNDIYIMPSLFEGFSLTIFEALSSGLPVIATKNSGAEKIITNEVEGFVIEAGSIDDIINKVLWFVDNRQKIELMSLNSALLSSKYTWEVYAQKILSTVNNLDL